MEESVKLDILELEKEQQEFEITGYSVQAIQVQHGDCIPSYGYVIHHKLGLTGDSVMCKAIEEIQARSEIMIADASLLEGDNTHMGIDTLKELVQVQPNKTIIATHMREQTRQALKKEKISNLIIPEDGYCFEI